MVEPYRRGMAKGKCFRETYRFWIQKAAFVLIAMETEMFVGYGPPRQRRKAESLLADFWDIFYDAVPQLRSLA